MKKHFTNFSFHKKIVLLVAVTLLVYFYLIIKSNPPLSDKEIINIVASKSLLTNSISGINFKKFIFENGNLIQPIPTLFNLVSVNLLPHYLILHKLPGILLFSLVVYIYFKTLVSKDGLANTKTAVFLLIALLLISPWLIQSAIYKSNTLLGLLLFIITSFYLYQVLVKYFASKTKHFLISNSLLALTGLPGFVSSVTLLLSFILTNLSSKKIKKANLKLFLLSLVTFIGIFIINKDQYLHTLERGSLITKINPTELAHKIDERQMIDYLAANKKFLLPKIVRKLTYNKLSYGLDITLKKAISLFDFEQFASPNESYDITKLSGILPKGNIPLLYIWEIPLILLGIFLIYKDNKEKRFWFTTILLSSLVPVLIFEKKDFSEYGIFLHLPFFISEIIALNTIFKSLSDKLLIKKLCLTIFNIVLLASLLDFLNFLFLQNYYYLPANLTAYQNISAFLEDNYSSTSKYTITNRFGPTQHAIPAYLDFDFAEFWSNYNPENMTYKNLTFEQIDFSATEPEKERYYLGFPAEFIGEQDSYDESLLPSYYELVETLNLEDQLVYNFGKDIWIVKPK